MRLTGTLQRASPTRRGRRATLRADGVSFAYGRTPVLEGVDLSVRAGEFVALVGPNGSGKSTLLKVLLGSREPSGGLAAGETPAALSERGLIGYVPQRPVLDSEVPATVEEIVAAGRLARRGWWRPLRQQDREEVRHALDRSVWKTWPDVR